MGTPPDAPNIGDLNLAGLMRRVKISMPLGLVVFIGGCAAIATGETVLGVVLLVLGILCPVAGLLYTFVAFKRTSALKRGMDAREQAMQGDLDRAVRDYQQRHQGEY
jgi:hypothetical protein